MATRDLPIVGDSFNVGFRFQRYWDTPMANAFFCGELGAGLCLASLLVGFVPGVLIGVLITSVLKTYFHIAHMGVPTKSWRAILRPDRSWTSRGLMGIVFYVGFGVAYWLYATFDLGPTLGLHEAAGTLLALCAGAAALVVMTYQGFAMSHSTAISLWSNGLIPVSSFVYSATAGLYLLMAFTWNGLLADDPAARAIIANVAVGMLLVIAAVLLSLLHSAHHGAPGARKSVEILTRTFYAKWFWGVICGVGIALPALLMLTSSSYFAILIAAASVLLGFYAFRVLIFKAGVFEPIMSFRP
jgi:formate-dependent nitrite reductase membrane component NrfD